MIFSRRALIGILFFMSLGQITICSATPNLPTVNQVDLARYAGQWYEVSRLPMWFERNCRGNITATYTIDTANTLAVTNRCETKDGFISAQGIAEVPNATEPGQLRVRFAPSWLAWFPLVWGDYWIIDLDPEYRWVMVGSPNRSYLWILSRSPMLDSAVMDTLKHKAADLNFNTNEMINPINAE